MTSEAKASELTVEQIRIMRQLVSPGGPMGSSLIQYAAGCNCGARLEPGPPDDVEFSRRSCEIVDVLLAAIDRGYVVRVFGPGTKVRFKASPETEAVVTAFQMRGRSVDYEVAWFASGSRTTAWVNADEIEPAAGPDAPKIGFQLLHQPTR
jgi:hypothetical protein